MGKFGKKKEISLNILDYNICLLGESKIGKEQPISEPILTENGWVPMGEVTVGTKVYGEDGNLYNVIGVFPQGVKDVYEVTFRDGTSTRCGLEHLWTVTTKKQRENQRIYGDKRSLVLPLSDIIKDYKTKTGKFKYCVPQNAEIKFKSSNTLKLNPYILGLLLGDGGFTGSVVTFTNAEDDLFDSLENWCVYNNLELHFREFENYRQCNITSTSARNELVRILKELNLMGCGSREKFIPKEYKYSSIEDRYDILSGLINTDGGVTGDGRSIIITTYSNRLACDIADIARSLGYICTINSYDRTSETSTDKYEFEIEYNVRIISADYSKFKLSEKHRSRLNPTTSYHYKTITNIELVGREECQCIMVDNPNELYITKDYIVTHNTTLAKEICEKIVKDDGYIHFDIGKEEGANAIEGIVSEPLEDYEKLSEVVDDIVENKTTDYPNLKVVIWDTLDEMIPIFEAEVIRLHNKKNPDKKVDSISAADGGFMKGQDHAADMIVDTIWRLKSVGVSSIIIGHVKRSDITDPITQETYSKITADTTQRYFNVIKNKMHFIGLAYIDRNIVKEKTGKKNVVTKQDITVNKVVSESRVISFRDDSYSVDSGSRFADIVDRIPFDSDAFIKALQDAINAEKLKNGKSIEESKKDQVIRDEKAEQKAEENSKLAVENSKLAVENKVDVEENEELCKSIKQSYDELDDGVKKEFREVMKELGVNGFKDVTIIPTAKMRQLAQFFM